MSNREQKAGNIPPRTLSPVAEPATKAKPTVTPWESSTTRSDDGLHLSIHTPTEVGQLTGRMICRIAPSELVDDEDKANAAFIVTAVNNFEPMVKALEWAARSEHHSACPIPRGKGWTTITRDDCTCHVKAARAALAAVKKGAH